MKDSWKLNPDVNAICRTFVQDAFQDDIEMSGRGCSDTVTYGADGRGELILFHHPVFPTLRTRPNDTHASYQLTARAPRLLVNGEVLREQLTEVRIEQGILYIESRSLEGTLSLSRCCFPDPDRRACYETVRIVNHGPRTNLAAEYESGRILDEAMGPMGICVAQCFHDIEPKPLRRGGSLTLMVAFAGRKANELPPSLDPRRAQQERRKRIEALLRPLELECGNETVDALFSFAKLRAGESVFDTKYGPIHSPGGYSYYAATWCNDEVEYAGPYFAYTGDKLLIEASMNAYRMYMPFMSDRYLPIPSSVIAEGLDYWNGAGDRGDAAMYLYGASRFALTLGDEKKARELLPAILWCHDYCMRQKKRSRRDHLRFGRAGGTLLFRKG